MTEKHYQIIGLVGFIVAGFIFIAVGIRSDDILTVIGSMVWTVSCVIWIIPLLRPPKG